MSQIELIGDSHRVAITNLDMYSDNTPIIKIDNFDEVAANTHTMVLRPTSLHNFVTGMILADSLHLSGSVMDNLVLPYLPGARQDRINPDGDVLCTLRYVCGLLQRSLFSTVTVVDPHSTQANAYMGSLLKEYPLGDIYSRMWQGYGGVIAPDAGARRRAEIAAKVMGKPLVLGEKHRDVSTGKLSGFSVDVNPGKHYIVIDDICDGGGTFIGLGEKIREQGAYADLFVTHGIFSKGVESLKKIYKNIYTTDSMENTDGTMRIPVVERMIDYV